jgi:alkanesulfonate monooxygenase SsuD/methylene tetrahydromethanopterin reductase-like flavin-dependent oxidoreductase (luciferase family)
VRFLLEPEGAETLDALLEAARAARDHGLDGVLLSRSRALPAPLVAAAAVAAVVEGILIAAEIELGDRHPLEVAEEAAVVDVASGGRLVLVVRPSGDDPGRFTEALDLLRTAFAARPFIYAGQHWTVPARLAQNEHNAPARARLTPAPFQPRLEVWTAGALDSAGPRRALGHLADAAVPAGELGTLWDDAATALGAAALGAPRARRELWSGSAPLLERLRAGRAAFGQDWAVVRAPAECARAIGAEVRPRVQLEELPEGLEALWDQTELSRSVPPDRR